MRIIGSNPSGHVTVLDLDRLGAYRLTLAGQEEYLGVGVRYLTGNTFGLLMLAAISIPGLPDKSFDPIVKHGLTSVDAAKDKERVRESMKILYNGPVKPAVIDKASEEIGAVIDFYWWLQPFFFKPPTLKDDRELGTWKVSVLP